IDARGYAKYICFDFIQALTCQNSADLHLFSKSEDIRPCLVSQMLETPELAGQSDPCLHLVVYQQCFVLVAKCSQLLKELSAKMAIATFRLYGFDDNCAHFVELPGKDLPDLFQRLFFSPYHFFQAFTRQGKGNGGRTDSGPVKFSKPFCLVR